MQFLEPRDAAEAQYCLDHQLIAGREITVVFAEENRKKPQEMRIKERIRYLFWCYVWLDRENWYMGVAGHY